VSRTALRRPVGALSCTHGRELGEFCEICRRAQRASREECLARASQVVQKFFGADYARATAGLALTEAIANELGRGPS